MIYIKNSSGAEAAGATKVPRIVVALMRSTRFNRE